MAISHLTTSTLGACALLLALLSAMACGGPASQDLDALERVQQSGTLTIAYANEEPYGFRTPDGVVTGEAPEIARVVARELGLEGVESRLTEWRSLIPGLQAGRFDCIAAGMYITPERAENVIFSDPTYRIGEAFLVATGNPKALHSYADVVAHEDAILGVVRGTVERRYARILGVPDERVVVFSDNDSAVAGLRSGQIDAFGGTRLTVLTLADKLGAEAGVEVAEPFENPVIHGREAYGYGAFAFRPEDVALRDAFNAVLRDFLGSPEHRALVEPFGFGDEEMTGGISADQVLADMLAAQELSEDDAED